VTGNRLVHTVVNDFGREVMQRTCVGTTDIHARPPPDRLKAFKDLERKDRTLPLL
jgi:hypothetical protein